MTNQAVFNPIQVIQQNNNVAYESVINNSSFVPVENKSSEKYVDELEITSLKRQSSVCCDRNVDDTNNKKLKKNENEEKIDIEELDKDKISEHAILDYYEQGNTVFMNNVSDTNNDKYFYCVINESKYKLKVDNANEILNIGIKELKELSEPEVKCFNCNSKLKKKDTFFVNGNYICTKCSTMYDTMRDFEDPFDDGFEDDEKKNGIYILCDRQKHYKSVGNFITYTKRKGFKYEKLCQYCRLKKQHEYKKKLLNKKH